MAMAGAGGVKPMYGTHDSFAFGKWHRKGWTQKGTVRAFDAP